MAEAKKKRKKPQTNLRKRARRDVRIAYDPVLDELDRSRQQARREYGQTQERVSDIHAQLAQALAPLMGQYQAQAQDISGDLNSSLGSLAGLLPSTPGTPSPGEGQAASNLFGTLGAGGQQML